MSENNAETEGAAERLQAKTVYELIQREGEKELGRPPMSLWWSGVIAGIAISSSVLTQAVLHVALPDTGWTWALENFGYCVGFVIVILGRMQLFTENTITPVLPIMANFSGRALRDMAALWGIVLAANFTGTLIAATFATAFDFASAEQLAAMLEISRHAVLGKSVLEVFIQGIPAGFYVAALVWMLPSSKGFELWIIVMMTYLIAIGGFAHVIVGSTEAFLLLLNGEVGVVHAFGGYLLPALLGNIIGGTALFSVLAYAQVREEIG